VRYENYVIFSIVLLDLRNRPLLDTSLGRKRFVGREDVLERIIRAQELNFNTLLLGPRGAGATSLLHRVTARLRVEDNAREVVFVQASGVGSPSAFFIMVSRALQAEDLESTGDPLEAFLTTLGQVGQTALIVDGLAPPVSHEVFGRRRDELWEFPDVTWIVSAHDEDEAIVLLPPADAFFEAVIRLPPMADDDIRQMLRDRGAFEALGDTVDAVVTQSDGNPSVALRLAREALEHDRPHGDMRTEEVPDIVSRIERELGRPASRLAEELSRLGSSGPSDARLLENLGWSRPRAYQVFSDLERDGWVTASAERTGKPGRPKQIYRLRTGVS